MSSFSLTQSVTEPTRVTNTSSTLTDLVLVSDPSMIKSCTTLPSLNTSDHSTIAATLVSKSFPPTSKYCTRTVWHYRDADFAAANELLTDVPWDELIDHEDIETSWNNWKSTFLEIMSLCIPSMKLKAHKRLPWLTKPLLVEMKKRDALYRRTRKTGRHSVWNQETEKQDNYFA